VRVCVVAEYYPRRRDPVLGVWAHRQALAARDAGAEVRVLALERPIPPAREVGAALRGRPAPLARSLAAFARQPRRAALDGIEVEYVRFAAPPREAAYPRWDGFARRPLTRALARLHARWPFDLLHAHYALPAGAAAAPFARARGLPLAVSIHGGDVLGPLLAAPAARARVAATLRGASRVLCNSRATLASAAALAGEAGRMEVVHLGADPPADPPPRHAAPTVATLGHVVARKRHEDVARALARLAASGRRVRWVAIGDGPELPRVRALAAELGLEARFTGQLAPADAIDELARCHLMALPSVDEAFGVAYVEALACGVPAIGCRGEGGPEEIAALAEGMLLVPPRDPAALAAAIGAALARFDALSAAAQRSAAERFSWRACGEATVAAYERALARGPTA
jgi:teichuronic acid biosynthesis glycosyltransferase TuaC